VVAADGSLQALVRSASTAPRLADLLLEISRRADLRKLTEALPANVALADATFERANAGGELLGSLAAIIRTATGIAAAGGDPAPVTSAVCTENLNSDVVTIKSAKDRI
jgi:hypothetical protein